jgi:hypothetical protein
VSLAVSLFASILSLELTLNSRLTVGLFPDKTEKKKKLALLSVASGLGGVLGLWVDPSAR